MVEVLEGRAREPTGPCRAPRTHPGPGSRAEVALLATGRGQEALQDSEDDEDVALDAPQARAGSRVDRELGLERAAGPRDTDLVVRADHPKVRLADRRGLARFEADSGGPLEREAAPRVAGSGFGARQGEGAVPLVRLEQRLEPGKGSQARTETGERNVAERRHGRPCGQQSMDEVDGHRSQGTKASRLELRRRRRFWGSGISDHRQQRPDAQPVSNPPFSFPLYLS
ncbi:hypothetical protein KM043_010801 [Ampulex compressa]|nr:hypothetical protein KM043_010801 [Ampulex compressa]